MKHTDRQYEQELQTVLDNLLRMTGHVEQMIENSVTALLTGDQKLARATIAQDHQVNRLEVDTDDLCLLILAKRQPVASDLRFITLAMKMVTDLERIGDLAVNISERAVALGGFQPTDIGPLIARMSELNQSLLRKVIDAFVARDAEAAERICEADAEVDALYIDACHATQSRTHSDVSFLERGVHLQAAAKFLERIGDHITNLAEFVIFLVKGKDIRHLGKLPDGPAG